MTPRTAHHCLAALSLAVLLAAPQADAQPQPADALIGRGIALRRARRDGEAWALFHAGLHPLPLRRGARSTAASQPRPSRVGSRPSATSSRPSPTRTTPSVQHVWQRATADPSSREVRTHLATVTVLAEAPEARVTLDDGAAQPIPADGLALRVAEGPHRLSVEAPGHEPATRPLPVRGGVDVRLELSLRPLEAPPPPAPPAAPAEPVTPATPTVPEPATPPPSPPAPHVVSRRPLVWPWFAAAGGALALGVTAHLLQQSLIARWNDDACLANGLSRRENCAAEGDAADTMLGVTVAGYVAAGALLTVGLVRRFRTTSRESARALACAPSWGGAACAWRF
jgi:hypothetical protein